MLSDYFMAPVRSATAQALHHVQLAGDGLAASPPGGAHTSSMAWMPAAAAASCTGATGAPAGSSLELRVLTSQEGLQLMACLLRPLQLSHWDARGSAAGSNWRASRPGHGSAGRELPVICNHLNVSVKAGPVFWYTVRVQRLGADGAADAAQPLLAPSLAQDASGAVEPGSTAAPLSSSAGHPLVPGLVRRVLARLAEECGWPSGWATDGESVLYMASLVLPQGSSTLRTRLPPEGATASEQGAVGEEYEVAVDYQGAVQIGAGPRQPDADATSHGSATRAAALQVLDTVLRHGAAMRHPDASCAGRRLLLYSPGNPELHAPLGGGAEAWLGFEQVVHVSQVGITLSIDLASAAFWQARCLAATTAELLAALPANAAAAASSPVPLHLQLPLQHPMLGRPTVEGDAQQEVQGSCQACNPSASAAGSASSSLCAAEGGGSSSSGSCCSNCGAGPALVAGRWDWAAAAAVSRLLAGLLVDVQLGAALMGRHRVRRLSTEPASSLMCARAQVLTPATAAHNAAAADTRKQAAGAAWLSVEDHCSAVVQLQQPHAPCVDVGRGSQPVWAPLELCSVAPGQVLPHLTQQQQAALGALAQRKPLDHKACIEALLSASIGVVSDPGVRSFGVEVAGGMASVRARVLPAPCLAYGAPECMLPSTQGHWDIPSLRLPSACALASWAAVCLCPQQALSSQEPSGIASFLGDVVQVLRACGMPASMPPIVHPVLGASVLEHMQQGVAAAAAHFGQPCQLLLVLVPKGGSAGASVLLGEVKLAGDVLLGVPSEVVPLAAAGINEGQQPQGRLQVCQQIALRTNARLGGVNVRLAGEPQMLFPMIGQHPFMVLGAHMAVHPATGTCVAALVGSRDRTLARYSTRLLPQPAAMGAAPGPSAAPAGSSARSNGGSKAAGAVGLISGMAQAAKELLLSFYKVNQGRKPRFLLVYRSGCAVTPGDVHALTAVVAAEYAALREACFALESGYRPAITFVVVSHEHGTRIFPADKDNVERGGNILPGTVIDRGICSPDAFDFYLASHASQQGTTTPSHYTVVVDEAAFSADGIQLASYWLCHLLCCRMRSTAMPVPALYAQMAAERGLLLSGAGAATVEGGAAAVGVGAGVPAVGRRSALDAGKGLMHPLLADSMCWL